MHSNPLCVASALLLAILVPAQSNEGTSINTNPYALVLSRDDNNQNNIAILTKNGKPFKYDEDAFRLIRTIPSPHQESILQKYVQQDIKKSGGKASYNRSASLFMKQFGIDFYAHLSPQILKEYAKQGVFLTRPTPTSSTPPPSKNKTSLEW